MRVRRIGSVIKYFPMKVRRHIVFFCIVIIAFTVLFNVAIARKNACSAIPQLVEPKIHISVVACGDRLEETLVNIKSAVLFTKEILKYHILADDDNREKFKQRLDSWPEKYRNKLQYELYPITYPDDGNEKKWKKLFKVCATQRLFLPQVLPSTVDSILYVDTDILFLSPVEELWEHFLRFNNSQIAAMAPESESSKLSWYTRFARHPFYGVTGLNSGVMLMNLTRFRQSKFKNDVSNVHLPWSQLLVPLLDKYRYNITWGDQCLLNIIFHFNPEKLHNFACKWNYRPDHCMYGEICASAVQSGVRILHGCRGVYHNDKILAFKAIYDALNEYNFEEDYDKFLIDVIKENVEKTKASYCGRNPNIFTKNLHDFLST